MWMSRIACVTAVVASASALPGSRLNELVVAANSPW
jgi:hypothetical protein